MLTVTMCRLFLFEDNAVDRLNIGPHSVADFFLVLILVGSSETGAHEKREYNNLIYLRHMFRSTNDKNLE